MASVNKVILVGNLGKDPETRSFPNGGQVTNAVLATNRKWRDRQTGDMREETEWHNLVFSDRLAEIAAQYLRKGSQVYVEGQIRTRKYQGQDGQDRYFTEIRVYQMQMLGGRDGGGSASYGDSRSSGYGGAAPAARPAPAPAPTSDDDPFGGMDDDIPF